MGFGDPEEIRHEACKLRRRAHDVNELAARVASGHGVHWVGVAADRFRERLIEQGQSLRDTEQTIRQAASDLDHLADVLDERQAAIRHAMAEVEDAIDSARSTIARFADSVWDTLTGAEQEAEGAARTVLRHAGSLPPIGHPDWVRLAGRVR